MQFFSEMSSVNNNCALGLVSLMNSQCLQATKHILPGTWSEVCNSCLASFMLRYMEILLMELNGKVKSCYICTAQTLYELVFQKLDMSQIKYHFQLHCKSVLSAKISDLE